MICIFSTTEEGLSFYLELYSPPRNITIKIQMRFTPYRKGIFKIPCSVAVLKMAAKSLTMLLEREA